MKKSLNSDVPQFQQYHIKTTTTFAIHNPDPYWGQAQKCDRAKPVVSNDCISRYKSNYRAILVATALQRMTKKWKNASTGHRFPRFQVV